MASVTKDQLTFAYRDVATYDTPSLPNTALFNSDEEKIRIANAPLSHLGMSSSSNDLFFVIPNTTQSIIISIAIKKNIIRKLWFPAVFTKYCGNITTLKVTKQINDIRRNCS
jgi:hypothetical protein